MVDELPAAVSLSCALLGKDVTCIAVDPCAEHGGVEGGRFGECRILRGDKIVSGFGTVHSYKNTKKLPDSVLAKNTFCP